MIPWYYFVYLLLFKSRDSESFNPFFFKIIIFDKNRTITAENQVLIGLPLMKVFSWKVWRKLESFGLSWKEPSKVGHFLLKLESFKLTYFPISILLFNLGFPTSSSFQLPFPTTRITKDGILGIKNLNSENLVKKSKKIENRKVENFIPIY